MRKHSRIIRGTGPIVNTSPTVVVVNNSGTPGTVWSCSGDVEIGDLVFGSAADTLDRTDASDQDKMPGIGFVFAKPTSTTCLMSNVGELSGFTGLTPNALYYASATPGKIQISSDPAPSTIQMVGRAKNATTLTIMIGSGLTIG